MTKERIQQIEDILAKMIDDHLEGLYQKISADFNLSSFTNEIEDLKSDPVYNDFGLGTAEYALIRKVGRISISIGRRLGEIYDKIPRIITQNTFNLTPEQVTPILGGKLELDTCIDLSLLNNEDRLHVENILSKLFPQKKVKGIGIEIRYNFNPNDSSRLRKDEDMARLIKEKEFLPVYLVFSSISPRDEAIARLTRSGWEFCIGDSAYNLVNQLYGLEFRNLFRNQKIDTVVKTYINKIMKALYSSRPFKEAAAKYSLPKEN